MSTLYQRCLACICRRSRCRASALTGTREACRVVSVGQNWRLDCNKSLHSAAELVPGRSIDTVSFCGWAPCHAEAALCEYVKTTLERCGPFSLVVLSQRRSQVTPLSGHSDQNASETFSNKLQLNKVQSSLRQTSAKTTQVRSKAKTS